MGEDRLGKAKEHANKGPMKGEILDLQGAAELLGVSDKTLIKTLQGEDVPARKVGREWRFSRESLIDWLGKGTSKAYLGENEGS